MVLKTAVARIPFFAHLIINLKIQSFAEVLLPSTLGVSVPTSVGVSKRYAVLKTVIARIPYFHPLSGLFLKKGKFPGTGVATSIV